MSLGYRLFQKMSQRIVNVNALDVVVDEFPERNWSHRSARCDAKVPRAKVGSIRATIGTIITDVS